jgi:nucleotide-binding universal stress UspA family protein
VIHELLVSVPSQLRLVALADPDVPLVAAVVPTPLPSSAPVRVDELNTAEQETLRLLVNNLTEIASELQEQQNQRLEEMQQVAVELALAVASRLVHERIEAGDYAVELLVRQAVERLKTNQPVTIYLNPQDVQLLEKRLAKCQPPALDLVNLRLVGDALLERGDCRAEAGDTSVLSQMQEQLAGMRRHLLETLPEATLDRRRPMPADRAFRRFPDRRHTA